MGRGEIVERGRLLGMEIVAMGESVKVWRWDWSH
jgi:hypothetical protein